MSLCVFRWNPENSTYSKKDHQSLVDHIKDMAYPTAYRLKIIDWKKANKNDLCILLLNGTDKDRIAMIGKFQGTRYDEKDGVYAHIYVLDAFGEEDSDLLLAEEYEKLFPQLDWHKGESGILLDDTLGKQITDQIEKELQEKGRWEKDTLTDFVMDRCFYGQFDLSDKETTGAELLELKKNALSNYSEREMFKFLTTIAESKVYLPIKYVKEDIKEPFHYATVNDGESVLVTIFTDMDQIPEEAIEDFTPTRLNFKNVYNTMKMLKGIDGLILDPYTEKLDLSFKVCKYLEDMEIIK